MYRLEVVFYRVGNAMKKFSVVCAIEYGNYCVLQADSLPINSKDRLYLVTLTDELMEYFSPDEQEWSATIEEAIEAHIRYFS